jgi:hypothetical protein
MIALKPDGNKALEGILTRIVLDHPSPGYWLHGSHLTTMRLLEVTDHAQTVATPLTGDIWIAREDVLYLNHLPPAPNS